MSTNEDTRWMLYAIQLGARGLGTTGENPSVGCIIVKNGQIIGTGSTQSTGRPHAETVALSQAVQRFGANSTRGATAYVSLEPCAHTGKTAPCAQALIEKGIIRIVCPISDPDPRVAGKGFDMLRQAGIDVDVGLCATQATLAHQGFLSRITRNRPFVTLKLASSLDGKIATHTGDSRWITSSLTRQHVHLARFRHDAVMVGSGTMRADNPVLNVRLGNLRAPRLRIVIDSRLSTPKDSALLTTPLDGPVKIFCRSNDNTHNLNADVVAVPTGDGMLDLTAVLSHLAGTGINTVFCEGGGTLAASLLQHNLVDQLMLFQGNCIIGNTGHDVIGNLNIKALIDAPRFRRIFTQIMGSDSLSILTRAR